MISMQVYHVLYGSASCCITNGQCNGRSTCISVNDLVDLVLWR